MNRRLQESENTGFLSNAVGSLTGAFYDMLTTLTEPVNDDESGDERTYLNNFAGPRRSLAPPGARHGRLGRWRARQVATPAAATGGSRYDDDDDDDDDPLEAHIGRYVRANERRRYALPTIRLTSVDGTDPQQVFRVAFVFPDGAVDVRYVCRSDSTPLDGVQAVFDANPQVKDLHDARPIVMSLIPCELLVRVATASCPTTATAAPIDDTDDPMHVSVNMTTIPLRDMPGAFDPDNVDVVAESPVKRARRHSRPHTERDWAALWARRRDAEMSESDNGKNKDPHTLRQRVSHAVRAIQNPLQSDSSDDENDRRVAAAVHRSSASSSDSDSSDDENDRRVAAAVHRSSASSSDSDSDSADAWSEYMTSSASSDDADFLLDGGDDDDDDDDDDVYHHVHDLASISHSYLRNQINQTSDTERRALADARYRSGKPRQRHERAIRRALRPISTRRENQLLRIGARACGVAEGTLQAHFSRLFHNARWVCIDPLFWTLSIAPWLQRRSTEPPPL